MKENTSGWLDDFAHDFADAIRFVDAQGPVWKSVTSGRSYQSGIGPHPETETLKLVARELAARSGGRYTELKLNMPYPSEPKKKCDLVVSSSTLWAIEVKMLRLMGDNGKLNDNMLMHILSPYPTHRSALTDCAKLANSGFTGGRAVLIYGFDYPDWPMDLAIEAFERLARATVDLGERTTASFSDLIHPVHQQGRVFIWQLFAKGATDVVI
jgi:hypothetical protein